MPESSVDQEQGVAPDSAGAAQDVTQGSAQNAGGVVLQMIGIGKSFPGVRALDGVDFEARAGEVLALVGENGAGKSTLMKVLSGVWPYPSYEGDIHVRGALQRFSGTRDAERAGIAIIHQELNLIPELSVAENIFLDRQPRGLLGGIDWNRLFADAGALLDRLGIEGIRPTDQIKALTVGQQQIVEIAKALSLDARILVFDEPTSALTDREVGELFRIIRDLQQKGVCMIYISHKMDELQEIADRVAVLRDGKTIGETVPFGSLSMDEIIHRMVGRDIKDMFPKQRFERGNKTLEVRKLSVAHPTLAGKRQVDEVSFDAYQGEVLGISGLMGSGRSELVLGLFGALGKDCSGEVYLDGKRLNIRSPADAIASGIALVTEDRKLLGLVLGQSVERNLTLCALDELSNGLGLVDDRRERTMALRNVEELRIKTPGVDTVVATLSGGNQQKVVIAKWLNTKPRVLILDEPTRGIDVGAKVEIYKLMNRLVEDGVTVIMISSDLPEVMGMSDRILVMCEGRLAGEFARDEVTKERIMQHATGQARSQQKSQAQGQEEKKTYHGESDGPDARQVSA